MTTPPPHVSRTIARMTPTSTLTRKETRRCNEAAIARDKLARMTRDLTVSAHLCVAWMERVRSLVQQRTAGGLADAALRVVQSVASVMAVAAATTTSARAAAPAARAATAAGPPALASAVLALVPVHRVLELIGQRILAPVRLEHLAGSLKGCWRREERVSAAAGRPAGYARGQQQRAATAPGSLGGPGQRSRPRTAKWASEPRAVRGVRTAGTEHIY